MLCYIPKPTFLRTSELHNLPMVTLFLTVPKQLHNAIQSKTIFFRKMTCRYVPTQFLCAETSLPLMIILGIFADMKISRFFRTDIIEKVLFLSTWYNPKFCVRLSSHAILARLSLFCIDLIIFPNEVKSRPSPSSKEVFKIAQQQKREKFHIFTTLFF